MNRHRTQITAGPNVRHAALRPSVKAVKRFRTSLGLGISGTGLLVVLANLAHGYAG